MAILLLAPAVVRAGDPRAEIQATLDTMEHAAIAADVAAFMAQVCTDESQFATEMRHWAEDLAAHPVATLDMEIVEDGAEFDEDRAAFKMRWTWTLKEPGAAPARSAEFPTVSFVKRADTWLYAGEVWSQIAGDGFVVYYLGDDDDIARTVLNVFPVSRTHVNEGFEIDGTPDQVIKLYEDMEHLKATVYLSMPDPVLGGWNEPGESIKFMEWYAQDERGWTRAFAHEYGHVATWALGPHAKAIPWWVMEGVAELAAEEFDEGRGAGNDRYIRRLAAQRGLVAWDEIADYHSARQEIKQLAYHQGRHLVGYVSEKWGRAGRNAWLRALAAGRNVDEATRQALGMSFEELDREWRKTFLEDSSER